MGNQLYNKPFFINARVAVAAFFFISGLSFASWATRIPYLQAQLHLSEAQLGSLLLALPIGSMLSLPLSGWLVAKVGSRVSLMVAATTYPLVLTVIGFAHSATQLASLLVLFGLVGNCFNIAVNTQAVLVEKLYSKPIMAGFHGVWSLAGFLGGALGSLFILLQASVWVHFGCVMLFAWLIAVYMYPFTQTGSPIATTKAQPIFAKPDKQLLYLGIVAFCCMTCEGTMFDWSGVYFKKVVHAPTSLIALGYVAFMSTMALGRFLGDGFTAKIGIQKMLQLSGAIIMLGLLLAVFFPNVPMATIGFLLVGGGVSSVVPLVYSTAGKSKRMQPGAALAAVSSIGFIGFLIGPPMIGFIAQQAGLRYSFALIALLGLGTSIVATLNKRW